MLRILIVLLVFTAAGCATVEKKLSREWKVSDVQFGSGKSALDGDMQTRLREQLLQNMLLRLSRDSVYLVHTGKDVVKGKWWLSSDKKTLHTVNDVATVVSKLVSVDKKQLIFESQDAAGNPVRFICTPTGAKK